MESRLLVNLNLFMGLIIVASMTSTDAICPRATDIIPCTCDDEGLHCLKLNNSGLERIFKAPAEKKAIRRVWIFQTELTELKEKSFGDYIIRDLYLDLNQIKQVDSGAFGEAAKTLQSLSLTRNLLSSFPFDDLKNMKKLKQLGLGHNRIRSLRTNTFPLSETLESIDLSHNLIQNIEPFAIAKLSELVLIDLSRNYLTNLESNSLMVESSARSLVISLRGNNIESIAVDAFGRQHPHAIDLSHNNLTYLDEITFAPLLSNNTVIDVDGNPFSCFGCDLYKWLLDFDNEFLSNVLNFACIDETKLEDLTLEMIGCRHDEDST